MTQPQHETSASRSFGGAVLDELKFLLRAFVGGAKRAFLITTAAVFVFALISMFRGEIEVNGAVDVVALILVALGYGAYLGAIVGVVAGTARLAWKTVDPWMFVPLIIAPLTMGLALWGLWGLLEAQAMQIVDAVVPARGAHDWMVVALGPAARIGPPILVIALPPLVADLVFIVLSPSVLWELFVLAFELCLALAIGAFPAVLCSAVVLPVTYVRRYRERNAGR